MKKDIKKNPSNIEIVQVALTLHDFYFSKKIVQSEIRVK